MPTAANPRATNYLFTWKNDHWPRENLLKFVNDFESKGMVEEDWTCAAFRQIQPGDRAYLLKQGERPRGIFGRGRVASEPYPSQTVLPHRGDQRVNLRFDVNRGDVLCDPQERLLVTEEQLLRLAPRSQWQIRAAGMSLDANAARELDDIIGALQEDPNEAVIDAAEQIRSARTSQGFLVSPMVKKAIEEHAVQVAKSYYEKKGYAVEVKGKPYDLHCRHSTGTQIFVEVKGTQTLGDEVLLTRNEVKFARQNKTEMALFIVHGVMVDKEADPPRASGGTTRLCEPWDIGCGELEPLGYSFKLPKP
jgi:hypothetical protein